MAPQCLQERILIFSLCWGETWAFHTPFFSKLLCEAKFNLFVVILSVPTLGSVPVNTVE